jgi:hypothetical protein
MRARKQRSFHLLDLGRFHGRAAANRTLEMHLPRAMLRMPLGLIMKKDARDTHDLVFDAPSKNTRQSLRGGGRLDNGPNIKRRNRLPLDSDPGVRAKLRFGPGTRRIDGCNCSLSSQWFSFFLTFGWGNLRGAPKNLYCE